MRCTTVTLGKYIDYSGVWVPSSKTALHLLASKFFLDNFIKQQKCAILVYTETIFCILKKKTANRLVKEICKFCVSIIFQQMNMFPVDSLLPLDHCFAFTRFTFLSLCEPNSVLSSLKSIKIHVRNIMMAKGKSL